MIAAANVLTDLALSLSALLGLTYLHLTLKGDDPLTRRFIFAVRVTMMLFAGRALVVLTGGAGFRFLVVLAASLIPLAVLLLTEGLLRRHAPPWLKALGASGASVFSILAIFPSDWIDPARLWGLFFFQMAIFCTCGWLVIRRDRSSLSGAENVGVDRLALSLILLVPMIFADFGFIMFGLPVQISAIGVLALCWLALTLSSDAQGQRATVITFLSMLVIALLAGGLLGVISGGGSQGIILASAVVLAAILVVMVAVDARRQQQASQSVTILRHLAKAPLDDPIAFLRGLQNLPMVDGAVIIDAEELSDLQTAVLDKIFDQSPVLRRLDPKPLDPSEADHTQHLFATYEASHILQVRAKPRRLVALSMPSLAASPHAELELDLVQRMTALIGAQQK